MDKYYRYEAITCAEHDIDGELCSPKFPNPKLELITYDVICETPKGIWIGWLSPKPLKIKWISNKSKKKYAYPSKEEALFSFIKRKEKQICILTYTLREAEIVLDMAKLKQLNTKTP